jgi:hypothetical protein
VGAIVGSGRDVAVGSAGIISAVEGSVLLQAEKKNAAIKK